jgi:hypothetical protein
MSTRESPLSMEIGKKKYKERISKESKYADQHKNLPFTFSKPQKDKPRNTAIECPKCSRISFVASCTISIICSNCKTLYSVNKDTKVE